MTIPLIVEVYDKSFAQQGTFGDPQQVTINLSWMDAGTATVTVRSDHPRLASIISDDGKASKGARLWIKDSAGAHVMSGFVTNVATQGPATRALTTLTITDDFQIMKTVLGWVIPSAAITAQGSAGTYWTSTGPAETVILAALAANARDRLGLPLTIPATGGRGATITANLRMNPLYDAFIPVDTGLGLVNDGGFGLGFRQRSGGIEAYCWTPKTIPQQITEQSGIITDWNYEIASPTVTRAVGGGAGDGTLRLWREDHDATLESQIGWKYEAWLDDSGQSDGTQLAADLLPVIADGVAKAGLSVTFSQTPNFRLGTQYTVGDTVTVNLAGVTVTDRLTSATLTWTADGGYLAVPQIGDKSDDPDVALIQAVTKMQRSIRRTNASH